LINENCLIVVAGELDPIRAMRGPSILIVEAAKTLRRARTSIQPWIGVPLDRDPETDATGAAYATHASVGRIRLELADAPKGAKGLPGR